MQSFQRASRAPLRSFLNLSSPLPFRRTWTSVGVSQFRFSPCSFSTSCSSSTAETRQTSPTSCSSKDNKDPQQIAEEEIVQLQTNIRTHFQHANYTAALTVSETVLQKSMALFAQTQNQPHHPAIASAHNNIGLMHKMMGNYDLALKQYQLALNIYAEILGKDHASYAATLNNIGNLYRAQAMQLLTLEDSEEENEEQETTTTANTTHTHKDLKDQMHQVLVPSIQLNRQALECFEQAYRVRKVELGPEHVHTVTSQSNLGGTLAALIVQEETFKRMQSMNSIMLNEDDKKEMKEEEIGGNALEGEESKYWLDSQELNLNEKEDPTTSQWDLAEVHLRASFRTAVKHPRGRIVSSTQDTDTSSTLTTTSDNNKIKKDRSSKGKKERRKDAKEQKFMLRRASSPQQQEDEMEDSDSSNSSTPTRGHGDLSIQTISAAAAAQNLAVFLKTKADFQRNSDPKTRTVDDMEAYAEAKNLYLGSLRVRKVLLGESHPDTIATKFSLAELMDSALGDTEGAKVLREEILNAYEVSESEKNSLEARVVSE